MTNSEIQALRDQLTKIDTLQLTESKAICEAIWLLADTLDKILYHLKAPAFENK